MGWLVGWARVSMTDTEGGIDGEMHHSAQSKGTRLVAALPTKRVRESPAVELGFHLGSVCFEFVRWKREREHL